MNGVTDAIAQRDASRVIIVLSVDFKWLCHACAAMAMAWAFSEMYAVSAALRWPPKKRQKAAASGNMSRI